MEDLNRSEKYTYFQYETLPKDPSIKVLIRSYRPSDLEETALMISKEQGSRQPYFINLNKDSNYFYLYFKELLPIITEEDMGVVAIYNNKIIGFISMQDNFYDRSVRKFKILEKFPEILKQLNAVILLDKSIEEFKKPKSPGISGYLTTLVVDNKYSGKGLGLLLYSIIHFHPFAKKFQEILAHIASYPSKILADKMGFIVLKSTRYTDIKNENNDYIFKNLPSLLKKNGLGAEYEISYIMIYRRPVQKL